MGDALALSDDVLTRPRTPFRIAMADVPPEVPPSGGMPAGKSSPARSLQPIVEPHIGGAPARPSSGKIRSASIMFNGKMYEAPVHIEALRMAAEANGMNVMQFIQHVNKMFGAPDSVHRLEGFTTDAGHFVSREQARIMAEKANQLSTLATEEGGTTLSTEDMPRLPRSK